MGKDEKKKDSITPKPTNLNSDTVTSGTDIVDIVNDSYQQQAEILASFVTAASSAAAATDSDDSLMRGKKDHSLKSDVDDDDDDDDTQVVIQIVHDHYSNRNFKDKENRQGEEEEEDNIEQPHSGDVVEEDEGVGQEQRKQDEKLVTPPPPPQMSKTLVVVSKEEEAYSKKSSYSNDSSTSTTTAASRSTTAASLSSLSTSSSSNAIPPPPSDGFHRRQQRFSVPGAQHVSPDGIIMNRLDDDDNENDDDQEGGGIQSNNNDEGNELTATTGEDETTLTNTSSSQQNNNRSSSSADIEAGSSSFANNTSSVIEGQDGVITAHLVDESQDSEAITRRVQEETRRQILSEAVVGDARIMNDDDEDDTAQKQRLVILSFLGLLGVLVLVAVIVGSIVGIQQRQQGNQQVENPSDDDTTTTSSEGGPVNDICENAISLSPDFGGTIINGTTKGATAITDNELLPCRPENPEEGNNEDPAVWYSIIGTGLPFIMTACSNITRSGVAVATKLSVVSGESCGYLDECIKYIDEYECGGRAMDWTTEVGKQYFVLVSSGNVDFELFLEEGSSNDICESSELLEPVPTSEMNANKSIVRDFVNATYDKGIEECYTYQEEEGEVHFGPGLWFSIIGTGGFFRASTCSMTNDTSSQQTIVSVYSGQCNDLTCAEVESTNCGLRSNEVAWATEPDKVYYLLVRRSVASAATNLFSDTLFELSIQESPSNDICETAIPINEFLVDGKAILPGSTMDATVSYGLDYCAETAFESNIWAVNVSTTRGLWYKYVGTGKEITVSTSVSQVFEELVETVNIPENSDIGDGTSCSEAIGVQFGWTVNGFTYLDIFNNSGVAAADDCGGVSSAVSGVWYILYGNGGNATASTCDVIESTEMDTRLSVFKGSCGGLECIASNDDACGKQSIVTWETTKDEIYYLVVHSVEDSEGSFTLRLGGVENDVCQNAIGPLNADSTQVVMGSTIHATRDFGADELEGFLLGAQECADHFLNGNIGSGVWYYIDAAKNESLTASTCDSRTEYQTSIGIYTGSCGTLTCLKSQGSVCGYHARASWEAVAGVRYFILVHGRFGITYQPHIGIFALRVGKTEDFEDIETVMRRQWFDSYISVFAGSCQQPVCTMGNDHCTTCSGTFDKGIATWISQEGVEYFVHVHSSEVRKQQLNIIGPDDEYFDSGPFNLQIQETSLLFSDFCRAPIGPLTAYGETFYSTTATATFDNLGTCGFEITSAGVWFSVLGTGDRLSASACDQYTYFEARVSIFKPRSGSNPGPNLRCDELECIDESDGAIYSLCEGSLGSLVSWKSTDRAIYLILVHGLDSQTGPFGLTMDFQVSNDFCEDALPLSLQQLPIAGSTISGTEDSVGPCGDAENTAAGIWYSVLGTGRNITANMCRGKSDYGLHLSVFTGSCDELSCVDGVQHGHIGPHRPQCGILTWESNPDMTYYVLISGGAIGRFSLAIEETSNDVCQGATPIAVGEEPMAISMEFATSDYYLLGSTDDIRCQYRYSNRQDAPGTWFVLSPMSDGALVASTCFGSVSTDTEIVVLKGPSCGNLTCLASNNNGVGRSCAGGQNSRVQFYAEEGETYYVMVLLASFRQDQEQIIRLGIEPFPASEAPFNDMCTGAPPVSVGDTVRGTTVGASIEPFIGIERDCPMDGLGVWYVLSSVFETAKNLTLSTCSVTVQDNVIPITMNVYVGSCDDLRCITESTSICAIHWETEPGRDYFIHFQNQHQQEGRSEGEFLFQLSEFEPVINDHCEGALPLSLDGEIIIGSTLGAEGIFEYGTIITKCVLHDTRYGAWYIFVPTDRRQVTVNTCDERTEDGASVVHVFSGGCGDLVCIPEYENNDYEYCEGGPGMKVSWFAEVGTVYYILISGFNFAVGNFALSFT